MERFESWPGEYQLAKLINISPNIEWWRRLHRQDGASIQCNLNNTYYPDFFAENSKGTCRIAEGKDALGRADPQVQEKRRAAERLVIDLLAHDEYQGQNRGYLYCLRG